VKIRPVLALLLATLAGSMLVAAQATNVSGTWTLQAEAAEGRHLSARGRFRFRTFFSTSPAPQIITAIRKAHADSATVEK
jgi:hypothetical protein